MPAQVHRDNGKTFLDVQGFDPGEFASSVHGVDARICQAVGESLSYEELICYGALAFRVCVHETMCPSAAHPCCGYMCIDNSNRALPWKTRGFDSLPWSAPKPDRAVFEAGACAAIKQSIDAGVPIHYGGEEDGLIIGYENDGKRWWCVHPYHKGGKEAFWYDQGSGMAGGKNWPWGIAVWTESKPASDHACPRELTIAALKQATEMWTAGRREAYFVGDAAYEHWIKYLGDIEAGRCPDPKGAMQGNRWCYYTLTHYRRIAAQWLKETATDLAADHDAVPHLIQAADRYTQLADACTRGLSSPWELTPGPGQFEQWTSALRQDQIKRLAAARDHDRAAIAAVKQASAALA
jgi:hypothetical protein